MYFRILVNHNGDKFFRTSRLHSAKVMLTARAGLAQGFQGDGSGGFDPDSGYEVQVLSVDDDGQGHILTADELTTLTNEVLGLDDAPTSTADIAAALNPIQQG